MFVRPTHTMVKTLLDYDPETGHLKWKRRDDIWHELGLMTPPNVINFNSQYLGTRAGTYGHQGYREINLFNRSYREHRIVWLWMTGQLPKGEIDHKNRDRGDNRWENLRDVSKFENQRNRSINSNNTSGYTGINYREEWGKWRVRIGYNGKRIHVGDFVSFEDAYAARKQAEKDYEYFDYDEDNKPRPKEQV